MNSNGNIGHMPSLPCSADFRLCESEHVVICLILVQESEVPPSPSTGGDGGEGEGEMAVGTMVSSDLLFLSICNPQTW